MKILVSKAQVATEYMLIIGLVFLVMIPLLYYSMRESNLNVQLNQANDAVNTLAKAADTVYSIGPGTRKYVWINMPGGIQDYSLGNRTVLVEMYIFGGVSDIFTETKADLAGIIPISEGPHRIKVEMLESGYVQFGEANDTIAPNVIWVSPSGTINYNGIVIRATTNEYAVCKYDEEDVSYSLMPQIFIGSALTHERDLGILQNGTYVYFVRCQDPSGNIMEQSAVINFTIVPPLIGNQSNISMQTNETYEPYPPVISLIGPVDNSVDNDSIILFEYNVTDNSSIWFCQLIINNTLEQTDWNIAKNITQNFTKTGIEYGNYTWNINCSDVHGNKNSSSIWRFRVNYTQDHDLPIVNLVAPLNNTVRNYWLTRFSYNVTDVTSVIDYCELDIKGVISGNSTLQWSVTDTPVQENVTESMSFPLYKANYTWNVSCVDNSYNANRGYSKTWRLIVNISAGEDAFLDSCAGVCGYNGFSDGTCENNIAKCNTYCSNCYMAQGDQFCTGGPEADTCCCIP